MSALAIKRKRGRPRRDEPPEINEFDIALIREFADRPAFYDRSCVHYRNRDYLDQQWEEMAQSLGYTVSLIKDRMIQLRNRYNLEKRRAESMQEQYNDPNISSQWPLFEYMSFLGDYIKSRRPYSNSKRSLHGSTLHHRKNQSNSSSEAEDYDESQHNTNDTESDVYKPNTNNSKLVNPLAHSTINHDTESNGRTRAPKIVSAAQTNSRLHQHQQTQRQQQEPSSQSRSEQGERRPELGFDKYKAFGQFLSASLIEMNEYDALQLVNKFTVEVVRSLRSSEFRSKTTVNSNDGTEISI